jgi:hypothetical protein
MDFSKEEHSNLQTWSILNSQEIVILPNHKTRIILTSSLHPICLFLLVINLRNILTKNYSKMNKAKLIFLKKRKKVLKIPWIKAKTVKMIPIKVKK